MAIEAFSSALEVIPRTLAENAGLDPVNTIIDLRKAHSEGKSTHGVNVYKGGVVDMAKAGIFAFRRAKKSDMEALSKATGGRIVNNLDDLSGDDLGSASKVDERKIGDSDMVFVEGCPQAKSVSVLLRGGTEHVVDEVKRAFEDAIGVVAVAHEDGSVLTGGGSVIAALSRDLRSYAEGIGGR